ncbi:MAG: ThiF family adenylyltransferase [Bdellovibrionales bacterium]|nr:ThiF family adenylyltransferase [Bdellovibrionales bacterium]
MMNTAATFNYNLAFSRNLGWVTEEEQTVISGKTVAIAGMGGVGGQYAEILTRLGVTKFHIADFDTFEIQNFNRQNCSGMKNLHRKKVEVIREKILDINPLAEITVFSEGLNQNNISEFLQGADLYLDGLDFFVLDIRRMVFEEAYKKEIPAVTIAPVGMGASLVIFTKDSMSFTDHFGIKNSDSIEDSSIKFVIGLTPTLLSIKYLVDRRKSNFKEKRAPSLPMGPYLCAGIAGTEALRILLNRTKIQGSPHVMHFDAYLHKYKKSYIWRGHKNIVQRFKFYVMKKFLNKKFIPLSTSKNSSW